MVLTSDSHLVSRQALKVPRVLHRLLWALIINTCKLLFLENNLIKRCLQLEHLVGINYFHQLLKTPSKLQTHNEILAVSRVTVMRRVKSLNFDSGKATL